MSSDRPNKRKVDAVFRFVCAEKEKKAKGLCVQATVVSR